MVNTSPHFTYNVSPRMKKRVKDNRPPYNAKARRQSNSIRHASNVLDIRPARMTISLQLTSKYAMTMEYRLCRLSRCLHSNLWPSQCPRRSLDWQKCQRWSSSESGSKKITIEGKTYSTDSWTNVPQSILDYIPRRIHLQKDHPISITRSLVESRFPEFRHYNDYSPVVTVHQNFDSLGFPADHPGRSKTDTYYINKDTVLRTHTSAHEKDIFSDNETDGYTISADVYRRDAVDRSHYPVFHQMEGALTWDRTQIPSGKTLAQQVWDDVNTIRKHDLVVEDPNPTTHTDRNPLQEPHNQEEIEAIAAHLKRSLEDVVVEIFSRAKTATLATDNAPASTEPLRVRWVEAYFPWTSPSWELEVLWQGDWLEVLGCGIVSQKLLDESGVHSRLGWAFGVGLERIAMLLYEIPDIRLFWSMDKRFLDQFREGDIRRFVPFSKHPAAPRDVAFWLPEAHSVTAATKAGTSSAPSAAGGQKNEPDRVEQESIVFHENDIMEIVRETAGDSVEDVSLVDEFVHPKSGRKSLCYRVIYRSLERTLSGEEANAMHEQIRQQLVKKFNVELR